MKGNNLGPADKTVSILIDRSYPVVKAVYENLETIVLINNNLDTLNFVKDNLHLYQQAEEVAKVILPIAENLDEILKADEYAAQAAESSASSQSFAVLSKRWAIETETPVEGEFFGSKYYADKSAQLKTAIDLLHQEVLEKHDTVVYIADKIESLGGAIEIVADNIDSVNTTATNIQYVNTIANDFTGNTSPTTMPDWGEVGIDNPLPEVPTGGSIYTVAKNIEHIVNDSVNMDHIVRVSNNLNNLIIDIEALQNLYPEIVAHAEDTLEARDETLDAKDLVLQKAQEASDSASEAKISETNSKNSELIAKACEVTITNLQSLVQQDKESISEWATEIYKLSQEVSANTQATETAKTQAISAKDESLIARDVARQASVDAIEARDALQNPVIETETLEAGSEAIATIEALGKSLKIYFGIPQGEAGLSFNPDYRGILSDRDQYDDFPKGTSFLDIESGLLYFKLSEANKDWTEGFSLKGIKGDPGPSANEILMDPDPVAYFDRIYGESHGDIIGDLVVSPNPVTPDPTDIFNSILLG